MPVTVRLHKTRRSWRAYCTVSHGGTPWIPCAINMCKSFIEFYIFTYKFTSVTPISLRTIFLNISIKINIIMFSLWQFAWYPIGFMSPHALAVKLLTFRCKTPSKPSNPLRYQWWGFLFYFFSLIRGEMVYAATVLIVYVILRIHFHILLPVTLNVKVELNRINNFCCG